MMCEHEFVLDYLQAAQRSVVLCAECGKLKAEIDLAAANARVAELEDSEKRLYNKVNEQIERAEQAEAALRIEKEATRMTLDVAQSHLNQWQQKAEQAEARVAELEEYREAADRRRKSHELRRNCHG